MTENIDSEWDYYMKLFDVELHEEYQPNYEDLIIYYQLFNNEFVNTGNDYTDIYQYST